MPEKKESGTAYALWLLGGMFGFHGLHRFYLGHVGMGLLHLFTFGFCWMGWILDAVMLPGLIDRENALNFGGGYQPGMGQPQAGYVPQYQVNAPQQPQQPYAPPPHATRPGGDGIGGKIALFFAVCFGLMCAGCFVFMIYAGFQARDAKQQVVDSMHQAQQREEAKAAQANLYGRFAPEKWSSDNNVRQLQEASARIHNGVETKLEPLIERYTNERKTALRELRDLRPQLKKDKRAARRAKRLLIEAKELKKLLTQLEGKRDSLTQKADELDFTVRSLERKLEVASALGKEDKAELEKILARSQALVEQAESASVDKGSLEEAAKVELEEGEGSGAHDPALEADIDAALTSD